MLFAFHPLAPGVWSQYNIEGLRGVHPILMSRWGYWNFLNHQVPAAYEHGGSNWTGHGGGVQPKHTSFILNNIAQVSVKSHWKKQHERVLLINFKILILDRLSGSSFKCKMMTHFQDATNCKSNSEMFCWNSNCGWASLLFSICHFHFDRKIYHIALIFNLFLLPSVYYLVPHFDLSILWENFHFNGYSVREIKSTLRVYFT